MTFQIFICLQVLQFRNLFLSLAKQTFCAIDYRYGSQPLDNPISCLKNERAVIEKTEKPFSFGRGSIIITEAKYYSPDVVQFPDSFAS